MQYLKHPLTLLLFSSIFILSACGGNENVSENLDSNNKGAEGETYELDFSHFFPHSHFMEEVAQDLGEELEDESDGRISVTTYSGNSLAESDEQFDAAATGSVDIALSVHGYTPGEFPLSSVMELPFMSSKAIEGSKNLWKLYNEFDEFDEEYTATVPLWLYTTDPGQLFTVDKPVKNVRDLKGMRIRSPSPETSEWLEALGATPVSMPMDENFEALERGVVDGTIAPWEAIKTWGLDDVIKYATVGNFYSTTMFVTMNEDLFNSMSEEDQQLIKEATGEKMVEKTGKIFDQFRKNATEEAIEKGVEIYELGDDELDKWKKYINPTIENWINDVEEKGLPGQEVYDRAEELSDN